VGSNPTLSATFLLYFKALSLIFYYKVVIEKERPDDDEPDIYGTVNDKQGDKLDIPDFVGTTEDIILHMSDDRYLKIVFLDESEEFEVDGGFNDNK
jgi:hypothetical protein